MSYSIHNPLRPTQIACALILLACWFPPGAVAAPQWSTKLDGRVRFYHATELGVLVAGTDRSLYGVDGESGDVLWRRKNVRLDETDVAPIPGTDIVLLSLETGDKTRLEAADLVTGDTLWRSEKVRGAVMQMALEPNTNLLAVVMARDARARPRDGFKRHPVVHVFDLNTREELWKYEIESEVEMMPARWTENEEVPFTLDNYRPPVFLGNRLYLFYEGLTSVDARTGKERKREKFRINEEGLALTEADPVASEGTIFISGRGRVRAVSIAEREVIWEAQDLGLTPEMTLVGERLFVRTGGQFTRVRDADIVQRGPYGVSAIDVNTGKVLWRYKGADKGITNIAVPDTSSIVIADRDDLIIIDSITGKRRSKSAHRIEKAAFVVVNERGEAVVGGQNEIAAFNVSTGQNIWRSRHNPPGRGLVRTFAAIAARAASLYFRYGGVATSALRGVQVVSSMSSLRWSGLATRVAAPNLTSLATNYGREYVRERFSTFGLLSRARESTALGSRVRAVARPSIDVEERLMDRLDPGRQLERLSRFLWKRRRLATLRGEWMYFYTDLRSGRGLQGVNINTGLPDRAIRVSDPDNRFVSDEVTNMLYVSKDDRLLAYPIN